MARPRYRRTTVKAKPKKPKKTQVHMRNRNSHTASGFVEYMSKIVGTPNQVMKDYGINLWKRKRRGK